jgi:hypothetical protein
MVQDALVQCAIALLVCLLASLAPLHGQRLGQCAVHVGCILDSA